MTFGRISTRRLLDSPMFTTRWRWMIGTALALPRFRGGKKVPPAHSSPPSAMKAVRVFPL
jgi:ATP-dependent Lhr-like helicase